MRIELNRVDLQSISTDQATKSSAVGTRHSDTSPVGDQLSFSQDTLTLSALATQALATPEVRQSQVDSLRQSVSSGQYELDPSGIANAILKG